jgi:predicted transcriptional regulator
VYFNRLEFNAQLARKDMSIKDLAESINMPLSTMYRKLNNNGDFDRVEIANIVERLDIEDPSKIFFASELT